MRKLEKRGLPRASLQHEVKEAEDLVTKAEQSTSGLQAKFDALNGERQVVEADVKTAANELRGVEVGHSLRKLLHQ